jgi:hypothetical protein
MPHAPFRGTMPRYGSTAAAMSAIASFYRLDRSAVPGLVQAAKAEPVLIRPATGRRGVIAGFMSRTGWRRPASSIMVLPVSNYLQENDRGVAGEYDWSGYALMYLMDFLENAGITLGADEYRVEAEAVNAVYDLTYLITSAGKTHLPALQRLDRAAAERYFDDMGYGFEQARQAIEDGLILLRRLVAELEEADVLVIHIG